MGVRILHVKLFMRQFYYHLFIEVGSYVSVELCASEVPELLFKLCTAEGSTVHDSVFSSKQNHSVSFEVSYYN